MTSALQTDKSCTTDTAPNLLSQAVAATKHTKEEETISLLNALTSSALSGTISWHKNVIASINQAIEAIDQKISIQLSAVMQQPDFSQLEGSWRGLQHLVKQTQTSTNLKLRVMQLNKAELYRDLDRAVEFDQSQIYQKIYEREYGTPGGMPYGALVGDYEFSNHPDDIDLLRHMSQVAAAAFCPFISAASPALFGFDNWAELSKPRDLAKIFDSADYAKWQSFRESDDTRFVVLTMPRVLARLPYGRKTKPVHEFDYEESTTQYCWMNAAYAYTQCLTNAFAKYHWCTAIRGTENGGRVDDLPLHVFQSDDGDLDYQCPTEVGITDRREAELSQLGFLPLCHYKNTDYAVFFGAQSVQKAKQYTTPEATANAAISTRMPYIMATSRFAHYLKILARDKVGSFMETEEAETWLNKWVLNYANANANISASLRAKYPLSAAKVTVQEVPGSPGSYQAVAWLRPWLQMEELTASMRLVANIPKKS